MPAHMQKLKLFHFPGACSRVTMTALEQVGCEYDDEIIDLPNGAQHDRRFTNINPRGKVPALLIGDALLTENAAILSWLNTEFPPAKLLPTPNDELEAARFLADMFWVSSVWHPYVRAIRMPIRWTKGDLDPVRERGRELLAKPVRELDERLTNTKWYYGDHWSIIDTYFYWCYTTAEEGGFSLKNYSSIHRHREQCKGHPAFVAALKREQ